MSTPSSKAMYALACLFMWAKLYGLMRIFALYAHFITTVEEVLREIKVFIVIMLIIILGFANLFYVLNENEGKDGNYISNYLGEPNGHRSFMSALISMYMISIGDFTYSGFSSGSEKNIVWLFFIIASFIILIVFMNLLITIIGNKLNEVLLVQEQTKNA